MPKHPIQPLVRDEEEGRLRYHRNNAVEALYQELNSRGIDPYSVLAKSPNVTKDDMCQFVQLIGYSHDGATRQVGIDDETYHAAKEAFEKGTPELEARNKWLERRHRRMMKKLKSLVSAMFTIDVDDLEPR